MSKQVYVDLIASFVCPECGAVVTCSVDYISCNNERHAQRDDRIDAGPSHEFDLYCQICKKHSNGHI